MKSLPVSSGDAKKVGLILGWGISPGVGKIPWNRKCNPLQCSCLENSTDSGAWRVTVHEVVGSDMTEETEYSWSPGAMCLWSSSS